MTTSFVRALTCAIVLAAPAVHAANLLGNAGFEDGLAGWETTGNAALRSANPGAFEGSFYVFGSNTPLFSVSQTVDLLAAGLVNQQDIDRGVLKLVFGGYQAGFSGQTDFGQITVTLFEGNSAQLNAVSLPSFFSNGVWEEQRGETFLLPGTRTVRFDFIGTRKQGSNNDAYLDAAILEVAPAPVPLPATLPLLAVALGGLLRRARRRS